MLIQHSLYTRVFTSDYHSNIILIKETFKHLKKKNFKNFSKNSVVYEKYRRAELILGIYT